MFLPLQLTAKKFYRSVDAMQQWNLQSKTTAIR